ncbi:MAG: hypothetical protein OXC99_00045 [Chloroflexi bacterium]|nr:hypothetical protein [Chloroflexota bacterium]
MTEQSSQDDLQAIIEAFGRIDAVEVDAAFAEHMASRRRRYDKHFVTLAELQEVFNGLPRFYFNRGEQRRAPVVMVGETRAGRIIVVPIVKGAPEGTWNPISAFEGNAHHRERYRGYQAS